MKKNPLCFAIIINWNGYSYTVSCIKSILKSTYPNIRTVLIDNGSKNNEAERIKKLFPDLFLIKNDHNYGYCKANNQGITLS